MDIVQKSWETQRKVEARAKHVGKGRYGRVLKMSRKPDSEEYSKTIQITGAGIVVIGGLGFVIWYLWTNVPVWIQGLL